MGIIYISTMFEKDDLNTLFKPNRRVSHAANKFNTLLCSGFALNHIPTTALALLPVTQSNCGKKLIRSRTFHRGDLTVHYLPSFNISGVKQLIRFIAAFFHILFAPKNTVVIYDFFAVSAAAGMIPAAKLRGLRRICVVTDLPENIIHKNLSLKVHNHVMHSATDYILLTEQMAPAVDKTGKKPAVVVEGVSDAESGAEGFCAKKNTGRRVVMYAGSLNRQYGIADLVGAFIRVHKENEILKIYGSGDYEDEIRAISQKNRAVCFFGSCPNKEVLEAEYSADLLVNPRSTKGEYTKYSFPSKVMEYMSTGTAVLMARLPGIPSEYYDYCLTFDDAAPDGLSESLRAALDMSPEERNTLGDKAREFVLSQKNNVSQAAKIIERFSLG